MIYLVEDLNSHNINIEERDHRKFSDKNMKNQTFFHKYIIYKASFFLFKNSKTSESVVSVC